VAPAPEDAAVAWISVVMVTPLSKNGCSGTLVRNGSRGSGMSCLMLLSAAHHIRCCFHDMALIERGEIPISGSLKALRYECGACYSINAVRYSI
jgi:hypothetical protein